MAIEKAMERIPCSHDLILSGVNESGENEAGKDFKTIKDMIITSIAPQHQHYKILCFSVGHVQFFRKASYQGIVRVRKEVAR